MWVPSWREPSSWLVASPLNGCRIRFAIYSNTGKATRPYDHYSLLATIEDLLGVGR